MDQTIRVPRNQTALMQHIQRLVCCGHVYWTSDDIRSGKLVGFIDKWNARLRVRADPPARAYRKRIGRASVHLVIAPDFLDSTQIAIRWWLLATPGKEGLLPPGPLPGRVLDCRTQEGRVRIGDYELVRLNKALGLQVGPGQRATWTWRLTASRYREWEALVVGCAKLGDLPGIQQAFACLHRLPLFGGIRAHVLRLQVETNRMLAKHGRSPLTWPELPVMRMQKLWAEGIEL